MPTRDQVYQLLFDWLKVQSGLVTIKANQKTPRPPRPYASILFLNPSGRLGSSIDQQSVTDTENPNHSHTYTVATEGMRRAVASINIFGDNANDLLSRVRDSLDRPDVAELFERAGVSHLEESQVNDLTALEETQYLERAQMDLTVAFVAGSEADVGTIEEVKFQGTVDGRQLPMTTVNDS